jgi:hypothetical protein
MTTVRIYGLIVTFVSCCQAKWDGQTKIGTAALAAPSSTKTLRMAAAIPAIWEILFARI